MDPNKKEDTQEENKVQIFETGDGQKVFIAGETFSSPEEIKQMLEDDTLY